MSAPFAVGDTVRVTFEGKVERIGRIPGDESAVELKINPTNGDHTQYVSTARVESIEKIEPAVETFKAGDVVRSKGVPDYKYALGEGGYFDLYNGLWNKGAHWLSQFTPDRYERVEVG